MSARSCTPSASASALAGLVADLHSPLYSDNAHSSLQCPIKPGEYTIEETVALPAEIPRGMSPCCSPFARSADSYLLQTAKFQVSARVFTQEELPAACVDLWSE